MESKWQRLVTFLAVAATAICVLVPMAAAQSGPLPPSEAIDASSANWAAKAKLLDVNGQPRLHLFAPTTATKAASANWAAKAKLLDTNGRSRLDTFIPSAAVQASSANWAAKANLLDVTGHPFGKTVASSQPGTGFHWGDFSIGALAMLGLLLLGVGVMAGAHYGRRSTVLRRPA